MYIRLLVTFFFFSLTTQGQIKFSSKKEAASYLVNSYNRYKYLHFLTWKLNDDNDILIRSYNGVKENGKECAELWKIGVNYIESCSIVGDKYVQINLFGNNKVYNLETCSGKRYTQTGYGYYIEFTKVQGLKENILAAVKYISKANGFSYYSN
ncbi:MAG: hypothetical protein IPO46_09975 [Chitinophagaceae bacterium]|jgi:hypothetical protein|nr:hypothetical protein [Chitinophagaceae bacterium]MBK8930253.1 hypothetical protein [Chitinophagaceae bacterium]MBK9959220.1 hypothetical protein [Chitinophagaceae bacterium]MBL0255027.1 hypothetical protein [Chitinophagaceae bacterium]MBP8116026.1 hypothetical protein [Chitinophagaceae bacterium]